MLRTTSRSLVWLASERVYYVKYDLNNGMIRLKIPNYVAKDLDNEMLGLRSTSGTISLPEPVTKYW